MIRSATPTGEPAGERPAVSLVVVNARVWTGDPRRPWADALAVSGPRLAAVGSSAEVRKLAGAAARVVDARGGLLVPGAHDDPHRAAAAAAAVAAIVAAGADTAAGAAVVGPVLVAGAPADFTLLDHDPTRPPPGDSPEPRVVLAVARGEVVADRPF